MKINELEKLRFPDTPQDEEIWLEIKKSFDNKLFYKKGDKLIVDFKLLSEQKLELYDNFMIHPKDFIQRVKFEMIDRFGTEFPIKYLNLNEEEEISNFRIEHLGKVIKVKGMLSNATGVLAKVVRKEFECSTCGNIIHWSYFNDPKSCSCGSKDKFKLKHTTFQNIQDIILEENQDDIGDRSPKKTRVRLVDELCDKDMNGIVRDGNKIEVIGIVEEIPLKKDNKTQEEIFQFRLFALQVKSLENEFDETIDEEDIKQIEEISVDNPLKKLGDNLAPDIIGHTKIKQSLVLSMVGGVPQVKSSGKKEKHLIHILLVGDAGVAKTSLLTECHRRHYKSRYISGERLSEAGLVASIEKDELLGAFSLKAGYLPKCNKGMAIIDELDKADKGTQKALHTPMESGIVTIAKAGISATLNSEVTILVGANPKNGRFDISKPLVEQIDMEETLLSRFDLIHVMQDKINQETDKEIAESIWSDDSKNIEIDVTLFRKYIKYTQKFKPKFNNEAKQIIIEFYPKIRKQSKSSDSNIEGMPIVARHLKGIRRLAEASAKIRLSNNVEEEDVKVAIDLFKDTLFKLGMDSEGVLDMSRLGPGRSAKTKKTLESGYNLIKKCVEQGSSSYHELETVFSEQGTSQHNFREIIDQLNREGMIYQDSGGKWNLI